MCLPADSNDIPDIPFLLHSIRHMLEDVMYSLGFPPADHIRYMPVDVMHCLSFPLIILDTHLKMQCIV